VLPLTTRIAEGDAFPLRVRVRAGVCHLTKDSDVLVDQILAWDNKEPDGPYTFIPEKF
jgi:hypothetical protein